MAYIDTSVLTSYYWREKRTERVQARLAMLDEPVLSPLVEVEFHCVIARQVRTGACAKTTAHSILRLFRSHVAQSIYRVVPVDTSDYVRARNWIAELDTALRVLDAIHLAVAHSNGLVLLTADRALARTAAALHADLELLD